MPTNEILEFCPTDTGTNLLTIPAYIADAERLVGNQPGIARDVLCNRALRQACFLAASLAEAVMTSDGEDVLDDADVSALAARILNMSVIPDATTTVKGKAALATPEEVQNGENGNKIVTPQALATLTATLLRRGLIKLATGSEALAGEDAEKAITPATLKVVIDSLSFSVPDATTSVKGIAALATSADSQTGQNGTKIITPATLSARTATTSRTGLAELAIGEEALGGTDNERIVTSAGLASFKNYATNGYQKLPGGLIFQWGIRTTSFSSGFTSYPVAFPAAVYNVTVQPLQSSSSGGSLLSARVQPDVSSLSQFYVQFYSATGLGTASAGFYWSAIGR